MRITKIPSSAASAAICFSSRWSLKPFSSIVSSKCLPTLYLLRTLPTRTPILSRPASEPFSMRPRNFSSSFSVASSNASRLKYGK